MMLCGEKGADRPRMVHKALEDPEPGESNPSFVVIIF
jgi:hypothetical protein